MNFNYLKKIAQKIGMDKSIAYSSGARIVQGFTGVASVFFITSFLTGVEQGFYYTFGSILALQVFFELGLTGIMTQYVAHEASHLTLNENRQYDGDDRYKSRLSSLLKFCVKWYSIISVLVFIFLVIVGFVYFKKYGSSHENVNWFTPWLLICFGTAVKLFQSPINSFFWGLGFVKEMSKASFYQQIILPAFTWLGLALGFKLYVMGIGYLLSVFYWQFFIYKEGLAKVIYHIWKVKLTDKVSYMKEIFPFQWRIALSWVSGYFVSQLFNPILFATEGAVVAGQMGMTLQALNAVQTIAYSWQNTKIPLYSNLIALKNFAQLDIIFKRTLRQMILVCCLLLLIFFCILYLLNVSQLEINSNRLSERFLSIIPVAILMITIIFQQFTNSWAVYLRCHKKEPYLLYSICGSLIIGGNTLICGNVFGLYGIIIGYCIFTVLLFPWGYYIYIAKKTEYHN